MRLTHVNVIALVRVASQLPIDLPGRKPFERYVQRPHAEQRNERHAAEACTVHGRESHVLARRHVELDGLPHERIVREADGVRARARV